MQGFKDCVEGLKLKKKILRLFLAVLGLLCCSGFSLIERQTFIEVQRPLSVVASLVAEMGFSVLRLQEFQLLGSKAQAQQL